MTNEAAEVRAFCLACMAEVAKAFPVAGMSTLQIDSVDYSNIGAFIDISGVALNPMPIREIGMISALARVRGQDASICIHYDRADGAVSQIELLFQSEEILNGRWDRRFSEPSFELGFG